MKIACIAADLGLPVANHGFSTYINVAAALHWLNAIPNALIAEYVAQEGTPLRDKITHQHISATDGYLAIPQGPGLGIDLNEEEIARYRVEPSQTRAELYAETPPK
jgi:L-alanine-DL-glutamate epimerase-like enolase superfamily enzyme